MKPWTDLLDLEAELLLGVLRILGVVEGTKGKQSVHVLVDKVTAMKAKYLTPETWKRR